MATFDVTIANDPGTQSDGTTGAPGTLSWALAQANASPGPHTINIQTDVVLTGPLSPIFNSVTIEGNGHAIDAGGATRIFMVGVDLATMNDPRWANSIIAERPQVAINDLLLVGGLAQGGSGGFGGGGGGLGAGGALFVNQSADVTLTNVNFLGNQAVGGTGAIGDTRANFGGGGGLSGSGGGGDTASTANAHGGGGGIFGDGGTSAGLPDAARFDPVGGGGGGIFGTGGAGNIFAQSDLGGGAGGGGYSGNGGASSLDGSNGGLPIAGLNGGGGGGGIS